MSIENFSDRAIFISEFLHYLLLYHSAELYIVAFSLSLLLIQCFIDLQSRLLPDIGNLALGSLGLTFHALPDPPILSPFDLLLGAVTGAASLYLIRFAFLRFAGREALGLGDVKFAAAAGIWVGAPALPTLFFLAATLTLAALPIRALLRRRAGTTEPADPEIPFGPGLCAATAIVVGMQLAGLPLPPP